MAASSHTGGVHTAAATARCGRSGGTDADAAATTTEYERILSAATATATVQRSHASGLSGRPADAGYEGGRPSSARLRDAGTAASTASDKRRSRSAAIAGAAAEMVGIGGETAMMRVHVIWGWCSEYERPIKSPRALPQSTADPHTHTSSLGLSRGLSYNASRHHTHFPFILTPVAAARQSPPCCSERIRRRSRRWSLLDHPSCARTTSCRPLRVRP